MMIGIGILAGGLGTRISEETQDKPKPMVEINGIPILSHLIESLKAKGALSFCIAVGYKGDVIKKWIDKAGLSDHVKCLDTGETSMTGFRVKELLKNFDGDRMLITYGDALANISLDKLLNFHTRHGRLATVTAVHPPARFGHIEIQGDRVLTFNEKLQSDEGWINGGYFILEKQVCEYIINESLPFEVEALPQLAREGNLMAYKHDGFWKPMDTLRDKIELESIAKRESLPWLQ
jgi:glucose-1-phosphate cytidylyltransferase